MIVSLKKFKVWCFYQNNSGGYMNGPEENVFIEAKTYKNANIKAEETGIYFDGCEYGIDCSCCGDRWSRLAYYDKPFELDRLNYLKDSGRLINEYCTKALLFIDNKKIFLDKSGAKILDDFTFSF
jgi:hypothetical protein